jgi:hypothetical protein
MDWFSFAMSVLGLCVFEVVSSIDNAVVNADVLATMQAKWRKWFLFWGLIIAVFLVRGLLPWLIVWMANPTLGPIGALTASFSTNADVSASLERSAPILLMGGGIFLVLLFVHWLFLEEKHFGLSFEEFFSDHGVWFYTISSLMLTVCVWFALKRDPMIAFSACVGFSVFFLTHGFKQFAARAEEAMTHGASNLSDISKLLYLEVIDATFSIDGVIGAFAFTMSVPVIILGNGLGAFVVRELTVRGVDKIRNYPLLKNGAMYSIGILGTIMTAESFGVHVPDYLAPLCTFVIVGLFFWLSVRRAKA